MIFESNLPRIEIPNMNVADYVLSECERLSSADHRVFVDSATNEFVTVDQLIIYTRRFATSLRSKCGICAGDVVATFANNSQQLMSTMEDTTEIEDNPFSSGQPENFAVAPAYLCYSSGTTGKPKGVVLTHRNMIANAMQINQLKKLDMETMNCQGYETYLGLAPFCHAYGLSYVLHSSVSLGGRIVVMRRYTFENFLKAVQEYRITFGYLVPPIVCALSKDPRVSE
ncbi:hypothetical protein H4R24_004115 [Coemansia sp. RSA 988]|nr:hypothetical protein H4R24_004115 [Coemansia sp. RSA 988]